MNTTIIGIGLIGGSFALSLREHGISDCITGFDLSPANARKALEMGIVDKLAATMAEAMAEADLIVLSTPVDTLPLLVVKALNKVTDRQVVMDMGSIKAEICEAVTMHPRRGRFVPTHPMWGTEHSGPEAAVKGAFTGRVVVLCDTEQSDPDALRLVEEVYEKIGMPVQFMTAEEQDVHTAYVSHVSHIASYALALTVLEKEREEDKIFDLASAGFASTVRLAKSSPSIWVPIFMGNKYNVLDVLREHIHQLQVFRKMLEQDDVKGLYGAIEKANTIRRIIK